MLSAEELTLLAQACRLRVSEGDHELSFGVVDDAVPIAERLGGWGLLCREWCSECHDNHWRATDLALEMVEEHAEMVAMFN